MSAYTPAHYSGNGTQIQFAVPFEFLSRTHVYVNVAGVDTAYTWVHDGMIELAEAPATGVLVEVYRETSPDTYLVDFTVPGTLTEEEMDLAYRHNFFLSQEAGHLASTVSTEAAAISAAAASGYAANSAASAADSADSAAEAAASAALAETHADNAATSATAAAAAVGAVRVSTNDTTPASLGTKLVAGPGITLTEQNDGAAETLTISSTVSGVPTGAVMAFAWSFPPSGWLECAGQAVSRTTYLGLFLALGTTFGVGDGSTTFNLPDLRGEFIRGFDNGRGVDLGRVFGSTQDDEFELHGHPYVTTGAGDGTSDASGGIMVGANASSLRTAYSGTPSSSIAQQIGGSGGTETRPRNVALMYCIKV